ncbi:HSP 70h [Dregea volubilis virus 1]|nr:HSP 70h [Dregea volubilis virus 1]
MVVLGLDFGTTYSSLSLLKNEKTYVLLQQNSPYVPTSIFMFEKSRQVAYGYDAEVLSHATYVSGSFYKDLKRWVGCNETNLAAYKRKLNPHYGVEATAFGKSVTGTVKLEPFTGVRLMFALPDLIASFVRCMVADAESSLSISCTGVICSVPAAYNSSQRNFMMECVKLSGYSCLHIINEPSAAAFSVAPQLSIDDTFCLVYDFGGGTFDVSGVSVMNNTFVVRASGGDMNLGGRDVDRAFIKTLYSKARLEPVDYSIDISPLKEKLSESQTELMYTLPGATPVDILVKPSDLAEVVRPFAERTIEIMRKVYRDYIIRVNISASAPNEVGRRKATLVMVGGSSYLPGLSTMLERVNFIRRVVKVPDPRSAVAVGCGYYSLCLSSKSPMLLVDCAAHHLSIPSLYCRSIVLVPAGAPIPFSGKRSIQLSKVNPASVYDTALFEGDSTRCMLNDLLFKTRIPLSKIGVTAAMGNTITITIVTKVTSLGTVLFSIYGPSGVCHVAGDDRAFDFSSCPKPTRLLYTSHYHLHNRVRLLLSATRKPETRAKASVSDYEDLYSMIDLHDINSVKPYFKFITQDDYAEADSYLGKSVQKVLRGSRFKLLSQPDNQ